MIKIYTKMPNGRILVTKHYAPEELKIELEKAALKCKKMIKAYQRAMKVSQEIWNMRVTI